MTDFDFDADDTDDVSIDDSPLQTADDDTESTARHSGGKCIVELSDEFIDHINVLGTLRNKSSGGTGVTHADLGDGTVQRHGMGGEAGLHIAYDEYELDEEIYEGHGDGGIDGTLRLDGEVLDVDVKTPTYADDPWLKVEAGIVESKSEDERADAYVLATESDGTVTYHGWIRAEDLLVSENKRQAYKRSASHYNYVIENTHELNEMPPLTNNEARDTTGNASLFSFEA